MKKVMMYMLVLIVGLGISLNVSYAQETMLVRYINSEESKNISLESLLNVSEDVQIIDNGGYQIGVPGEYNVKFYEKSNLDLEKECKVVIVESQGTVIDIEAVGGNIKVVDSESKISEKSLEEFSNNAMVIITVKKNDGTIQKVQTHVVNNCSGGGGGPIDEYGSYMVGSGFTSAEAYPYWMQYMAINANQVKYYNPLDEVGNENYLNLWIAYFAKENSNMVTSDNGAISIKAPNVGAGDDLKLETNDVTLTDEIKSQISSDAYKAYNISLTDMENNQYQINGGIELAIKVPENMDKNKVVVYKVDGSKTTEIKSHLKDNNVIFEAPVLPGQYILSQKAVDTANKPEDNKDTTEADKIEINADDNQKKNVENHNQQENSVKSNVVNTADSYQFLLYLGCSVVALLGLMFIKKTNRN